MYYYNNELPLQQGWICPKCGRVNAPWLPTCGCVSSQTSGTPYLVKTSSISRDSYEITKDESQTIRCPKCGRTDYIRDMEKDMGIKGSGYKYKCINCNTYIKDEPQLVKDLVKAFCEDGTWLERQGVYTLTLAEAKQRAVDIIESVLAKDEQNGKE